MTRNRKMRIRRFTLVEALAYSVAIALVGSVFGRFYYATVMLNRQALQRTARYQEAWILQRAWRENLAGLNDSEAQVTDGVLKGGLVEISVVEKHLQIKELGDVRKLLLPQDSTATIHVENRGADRLAVLTLLFPAAKGFRAETIRITAPVNRL